jgi:hypothetical protein
VAAFRKCFAGLLSALVLTGCVAQPEFDLPVQWTGGSGYFGTWDRGLEMSILLREDSTAALENIPGGQWVQTDEGICWDDTQERYTGEATWRMYSNRGVELLFEDSDVIIWADPGKFGSYSWSGLKMVNCAGDNDWLFDNWIHN